MELPIRQRFFFGIIAFSFLVLVIELVRRRKLAEEHSLLWIIAALMMALLVVKYEIIAWLTKISGVVLPTSMILFLGILFCLAVIIHLSICLSHCMRQIRRLAQELALLRQKIETNSQISE